MIFLRQILILLFVSGLVSSFAQSDHEKYLDSLQDLYRQANNEFQRTKTLIEIADKQGDLGLTEEALKNINMAIASAEKNKWDTLMGRAYGVLGTTYYYLGNFPLCLDNLLKCEAFHERFKDTHRMAGALSNMGMVYDNLGDIEKSLDCYSRALTLNRKLGNEEYIAANLVNIGIIYTRQKKYKESLSFFYQALEFDKKQNNSAGMALDYAGIAGVYNDQGLDKEALHYYLEANRYAEKGGSQLSQAINLCNAGAIYIELKEYTKAADHITRAMTISVEIGDLEGIMDANRNFSKLYEKTGKYKEALTYYKNYIGARDSLYNEENTKKMVRSEMNFEFEKKEAKAKAEQEKKEAVALAEKKKQRIILLSISGFGILILGFAIFAWRSFLQKKKANAEISHQKQLIEEKQKEILDSIYYARRIQRSLLTSEKYIQKVLKKHA